MPIVFDQVDAVVQPGPQASEPGAEAAAAPGTPPDPRALLAELERLERRRLRLMAD